MQSFSLGDGPPSFPEVGQCPKRCQYLCPDWRQACKAQRASTRKAAGGCSQHVERQHARAPESGEALRTRCSTKSRCLLYKCTHTTHDAAYLELALAVFLASFASADCSCLGVSFAGELAPSLPLAAEAGPPATWETESCGPTSS
jgi:hypothetical protein